MAEYRQVAMIGAKDLERAQTWVDNPAILASGRGPIHEPKWGPNFLIPLVKYGVIRTKSTKSVQLTTLHIPNSVWA